MLDDEDDEERYRRIQADQEAKNIGIVAGIAIGIAAEVIQKHQEQQTQEAAAEEQEQKWQQSM